MFLRDTQLVAALLVTCAFAPGAFAGVVYFTSEVSSDQLQTGPVLGGSSTFGKWIANCSELDCSAGDCHRSLSFWREEATFSSEYRSWPLRAQKSFSSNANWCRVVLVAEGAFVLTGSDYQMIVSFIGLDENGFTGDGEIHALNSFSCASSVPESKVKHDVGLTGTAMALLFCQQFAVFNRSSASGLWALLGDRPSIGTTYTYYPRIAPDASAIVLQRLFDPLFFELTDTGSWVESTLPANADYDSFILIDSTTLLQSQPEYFQPLYRYAGQIMIFHRSARFAAWSTSPDLQLQLDPGRYDLDYAELQALDYLGNNKIYAVYDKGKGLIIDYSNIDDVVATRVSCRKDIFEAVDCPVFFKGRSQEHPAFYHVKSSNLIIHPFGVGDTTLRGLFFFVVIGVPIIAFFLLIACCCCGKEIKPCIKRMRKSRAQKKASKATTTTSKAQAPASTKKAAEPTQKATKPAAPASSDTIVNIAHPSSAEERLISALSTVRQGIVTALVGIAHEQVSIDDAITIIALALTNALKQCQVRSESELRAAMEIITRYMGALLSEVISEESARNKLIGLSVQRAGEILSQQQQRRASNVEEALQFIRHSVEAIWNSVTEGKANADQATALLVVVGLAALRNCTIESVAELRAHMDGFSRFMLLVADQCAPSVPSEVKRSVINQVWSQILSMF